MRKALTRRRFIVAGAIVTVVFLLSACSEDDPWEDCPNCPTVVTYDAGGNCTAQGGGGLTSVAVRSLAEVAEEANRPTRESALPVT